MKLRYRLAAFLLAAGAKGKRFALPILYAHGMKVWQESELVSAAGGVATVKTESNALKNWPEGPGIFAEAGIIMDMNSGAILYAKNIDEKEFPASITKIMTALVALENSELTDKVHFTEESVAFLEYGDVCSREKRSQWRMLYMGCCWHLRMKFPMRLQTQWEMGMILLSV